MTSLSETSSWGFRLHPRLAETGISSKSRRDVVVCHFAIGECCLRSLDRLQPLALLVLRIVLGVIMVGHSYPKVFGGLFHYVQMIRGMGLPGWLAYVSVAAEFLGGILVILGLLTRCAALAIVLDFGGAIAKGPWRNGLLGNG